MTKWVRGRLREHAPRRTRRARGHRRGAVGPGPREAAGRLPGHRWSGPRAIRPSCGAPSQGRWSKSEFGRGAPAGAALAPLAVDGGAPAADPVARAARAADRSSAQLSKPQIDVLDQAGNVEAVDASRCFGSAGLEQS